jgi:hypothetical protein
MGYDIDKSILKNILREIIVVISMDIKNKNNYKFKEKYTKMFTFFEKINKITLYYDDGFIRLGLLDYEYVLSFYDIEKIQQFDNNYLYNIYSEKYDKMQENNIENIMNIKDINEKKDLLLLTAFMPKESREKFNYERFRDFLIDESINKIVDNFYISIKDNIEDVISELKC